MPSQIVLGNGDLLVNLDKFIQIKDLYWPHVGQENQTQGSKNRIGVFVDGQFRWFEHPSFSISTNYEKDSLVSRAHIVNSELGLQIEVSSCVDIKKDIFLRRFVVKNLSNNKRVVKFFFHQNFYLYENGVGDTCYYEPIRNVLVHYKRKRYFLVNMVLEESCSSCQLFGDIGSYACGSKSGGFLGTYKDAEDGGLSKNPIAQGLVDSVAQIDLEINGGGEKTFYYWICSGERFRDVVELNSNLMSTHPDRFFENTRESWRKWVMCCVRKLYLKDIPSKWIEYYLRSILVVRTQIDNCGAILAANDSDNLQFNKDTYSYMWPRDGAFTAIALDRAGFFDLSRNFFKFCKRILPKSGAFLHKYNPDGSLGSSWHPWIKHGKPDFPIQEDGTALVIYALYRHYLLSKNKAFLKNMYKELVVPCADFMCGHIDERTGLCKESYDIWEEREGVFTFTCSAVYAGLFSASEIAKLFGDGERGRRYEEIAIRLKSAILKYLYDERLKRFLRGIHIDLDGKIEKDGTIDSSLYALFDFGVFSQFDKKVKSTMQQIKNTLWVKTKVGGVSRYDGDEYFRQSEDKNSVSGNPWFISTLWLAKYFIKSANNSEELREAAKLIDWCIEHATSTGLFSEQVHPYTGEQLSVGPLTWSHSAFIDTIQSFVLKMEGFRK